ncbi:MAG: PTS transporter subunit EIIC, partial [Erysipelotrichaceae bacterium]|nr:PTS transporter subunit EIIC [Erysipelotrichaceae bacterium]
RAAEKFGGTPILGGMLGMITGLAQINTISAAVGLYNDASPLDAILRAGRGGVLAAVIGVWVLVKVEKAVRSKMPDSLDIVFTPLLSLLITLIPYIFIVMPLTGLISTGLCKVVEFFCMSPSAIVRILAGFISSALFLPMVAMGMHHGLVALYTVQLNTLGYVTLYPALAMAGAGQVGAALAIYLKCKKVQNNRLKSVITGALPAGVLGVGEPLIYGVTLPMGKPFITAGLGAGFGGAFVMAMQVAATTWGPSGLLAVFVMTAGPQGAFNSVLFYVIGLVISYIMGFIITNIFVKDEEVAQA